MRSVASKREGMTNNAGDNDTLNSACMRKRNSNSAADSCASIPTASVLAPTSGSNGWYLDCRAPACSCASHPSRIALVLATVNTRPIPKLESTPPHPRGAGGSTDRISSCATCLPARQSMPGRVRMAAGSHVGCNAGASLPWGVCAWLWGGTCELNTCIYKNIYIYTYIRSTHVQDSLDLLPRNTDTLYTCICICVHVYTYAYIYVQHIYMNMFMYICIHIRIQSLLTPSPKILIG